MGPCRPSLLLIFYLIKKPLSRARQHLLAPPLCRLDLVEREHVQTGDPALRRSDVGQEPPDETLWAVTAWLHHPQEPVRVSTQEARGVHYPDSGRDAKEPRRVGNARHADVDGQLDLAAPHPTHPLLHDPRVEAKVAHDV